MAKLKFSDEQPINLFPMIDILTGTIGCFIFFVSAITVFQLGAGKSVSINVQKSVKGRHVKTPIMIEWDGKNVVIHPEKTKVPLAMTDFSSQELASIGKSSDSDTESAVLEGKIRSRIENTQFANLLRRIQRNRDDKYIVVMVRPSGFDTLLVLRNFLLTKGIDVGYEPIDQNWKLELK